MQVQVQQDILKVKLKIIKSINIINGKNINYTVPQRLSPKSVEKNLIVFMRVNNIYKNKL